MTNQSVSGNAADLDRAVAVAAEYDALQGLSWMTLGGALVLGALTGQEAVYIALGAAFAALVPSWYHRRYGLARPTPARSLRFGIGTGVALVLLLGGFALDRWLQPSVSVTVLVLAGVLAAGQRLLLRRTGLTRVHLAVHALVALAAAGPLLGWGQGDAVLPYALVVAGLALVVTGAVDHRRLVQVLGPVEEPGDERSEISDER